MVQGLRDSFDFIPLVKIDIGLHAVFAHVKLALVTEVAGNPF